MYLRIGDVLVERGILTTDQVGAVLEAQLTTHEPFGVICERLFQVAPDDVEEAWAQQYVALTQRVDPNCEHFDEGVRDLVSRRQAWQFRVLPIRFDGDELMVATTPNHLRRALRFGTRFLGVPVYFVIADPEPFGAALCRRYPLAGMTPRSIDDASLDRLLTLARTSAA